MKFVQTGRAKTFLFFVAACTSPLDLSGVSAEPTILRYSEPTLSGLRAIAPYPNPDDVCQLLAPNHYTDPMREEGHELIACPKHERGAIEDRRRDGARIVAYAKHWAILSIRTAAQ